MGETQASWAQASSVMTRTYFAFGSNMSEEQMAKRVPLAFRIGKARLAHHRFVFGGYSASRAGGVATIIEDKTSHVDGVLYRTSEHGLRSLDAFEGVPFTYKRKKVSVADTNDAQRQAITYVLAANYDGPEVPSPDYVKIIWEAYSHNGFDTSPLVEAASAASARVFVYGTLRLQEHNHSVLSGAGARFEGFADLPGHEMYAYCSGFPAITAGVGVVRGEVYSVDVVGLAHLDQLESRGRLYDRQLVELSDGSWAYTYTMPPAKVKGSPRIRSGDWRRRA